MIDKASSDLQGTVKAIAVSSAGEDVTLAELSVRGRAPTFKEVPIKCTVLEGDTAVFRCRVIGEPKPQIQWSKGKWNKIKDGGRYKVYEDTTGENVLEIKDIARKDAGTYLVKATNEHGSEEAPATIIVTDKMEEMLDWKAQLKHR